MIRLNTKRLADQTTSTSWVEELSIPQQRGSYYAKIMGKIQETLTPQEIPLLADLLRKYNHLQKHYILETLVLKGKTIVELYDEERAGNGGTFSTAPCYADTNPKDLVSILFATRDMLPKNVNFLDVGCGSGILDLGLSLIYPYWQISGLELRADRLAHGLNFTARFPESFQNLHLFQQNALESDFSKYNVFFTFHPFDGLPKKEFMKKLETEAPLHSIFIYRGIMGEEISDELDSHNIFERFHTTYDDLTPYTTFRKIIQPSA